MTSLTTVKEVINASFGSTEKPGPMTPVFIEGAPGCGKTAIVKQLAADLGVGFVFLPASTLRPEDLSVPNVLTEGDTYDYKIFKNLPTTSNDTLPERGILLVDELPQGDMDVQKFTGQLCPPNSAAGTHSVKPGWLIVATGNRREDKAGANKLLTHMLDRFILLEDVEPTLAEWVQYSYETRLHPMIVAFHQQSEGRYLGEFDANNRKNGTYRSWSTLGQFLDGDLSPRSSGAISQGVVGEACAAQFQAFVSLASELPNVDDILQSVDTATTFKLPDTVAKRWFLCSAVGRKANDMNAEPVMAALKYLTGRGHEDMLVSSLIVARDYGEGFSQSEVFRDAVLSGVFDSLADAMGM
jgi:hypothetical protein